MRASSVATLAVAIFTSAISGCLLPTGGEPGDATCTGDFAVTVGDGLTPTFEWAGDAAGLAVAKFPEGDQRMWVLSQVAAPFAGPVTYGTVPATAIEAEGAAKDLEAGVEYSVTITLADGNNASCALFTP